MFITYAVEFPAIAYPMCCATIRSSRPSEESRCSKVYSACGWRCGTRRSAASFRLEKRLHRLSDGTRTRTPGLTLICDREIPATLIEALMSRRCLIGRTASSKRKSPAMRAGLIGNITGQAMDKTNRRYTPLSVQKGTWNFGLGRSRKGLVSPGASRGHILAVWHKAPDYLRWTATNRHVGLCRQWTRTQVSDFVQTPIGRSV
jgi:hypothetical protein